MKKIETVLTEAAALVRRGWTQGAPARDADGDPVPTVSDEACQWSALGAIWAAGTDFASADRAVGMLATDIRSSDDADLSDLSVVGRWNDRNGQTAEKVARALKRAARRAESTDD